MRAARERRTPSDRRNGRTRRRSRTTQRRRKWGPHPRLECSQTRKADVWKTDQITSFITDLEILHLSIHLFQSKKKILAFLSRHMRGSNVTGQQQQLGAAAWSSSSRAAAAGERTSEHSARAGTKERESLPSLFSLLSCFEEAAGQGSDSTRRLWCRTADAAGAEHKQ